MCSQPHCVRAGVAMTPASPLSSNPRGGNMDRAGLPPEGIA
jgi:hypothetical protein